MIKEIMDSTVSFFSQTCTKNLAQKKGAVALLSNDPYYVCTMNP